MTTSQNSGKGLALIEMRLYCPRCGASGTSERYSRNHLGDCPACGHALALHPHQPLPAKRGHADDRKRCADMLRSLRKCIPAGMSRRGWYHGIDETVNNYIEGMTAMRRAREAEDRALAKQFAGRDEDYLLRSDLAYESHKAANPHDRLTAADKSRVMEAEQRAAAWGAY